VETMQKIASYVEHHVQALNKVGNNIRCGHALCWSGKSKKQVLELSGCSSREAHVQHSHIRTYTHTLTHTLTCTHTYTHASICVCTTARFLKHKVLVSMYMQLFALNVLNNN